MKRRDFNRVYVWQLPVRIFHWLNALAIVALAITGYVIAKPPAILLSVEATNSFWFGFVRAVHFGSAYVFLAVMLLRLYYAFFAGNRYANWRAFVPFGKKGRANFSHVLKHDIMLLPDRNPKMSNISSGHNALAAVSYLVMFFMAVVMLFTGFGLYADNSGWWLPQLFGWVPEALGGDFAARKIHHFSMWIFLIFIVIHVYLVLFHDWLEGRGETSSIISGYKYICKERLKAEEEELEEVEA
ncbi:MAG: Ni/Fe-hydrogenase, b-type cytochrome subunit [Phaeodactylibacter sp.]|nr:Ni/Fe-hydrogenase, b-type cytochrome subunit [Phaeodactylibacter sp.]